MTTTDRAPVHRPELRDFLRNRRARVTPADAGLPTGGRRRTPGLRREEVAVLAGVGLSWYQWLEQGRDIAVSPRVLDSVARVLRLDDTERRHLYALAGVNPPLPDAAPRVAYCAGLQRLIEAWAPRPATMLDRYWNHVAWNESASLALGMPGADRNCLVGFFRHDRFRQGGARARAWERIAPTVVAAFRASAAERPDDEGFREVIDELLRTSPEFAQLWKRQDVKELGVVVNEVQHPLVGMLSFESTQLRLPARPDLTVVLYNPVDGTGTSEKVEWLLSGQAE
ncbi:helix-turn-helix transcriptional regulator [Streptomyces sp. NPDC005931]|uniref:helix-turn-helix transcriptional regulator n=1 Tax=Streptomyces sp. NPDC005931 TaxID=3364737 RepID=UPI0036957C0D